MMQLKISPCLWFDDHDEHFGEPPPPGAKTLSWDPENRRVLVHTSPTDG